MMMLSLAFTFEITNKLPTLGYMYFSGIVLALLVFAATYFHRQVGLITLLLVGLICAQSAPTSQFEGENVEQIYITHWNFSCQLTFALSIILFFAAIMLKRRLKRKTIVKK